MNSNPLNLKMYVSPRKDCPHIKENNILSLKEFEKISFNGLKCEFCSEINELWICISCGKAFCGRYIQNHYYEKHYLNDKSHCICISMLDLSVWCYQCMTDGFNDPGSYIESQISSNYVKIISDFKFGDLPTIKKNEINSALGISKEKISKIKYDNFIELLKNNIFKNICFIVGPGINIDKNSNRNILEIIFEKAKNKYSLLDKMNIEKILEKDLFISNPILLYLFLKEYKLNEKELINPNISHYFMRYLIEKGLANLVFTENFEGNEKKSGLLDKNIVYGRGNLLEGHCSKCNNKIDINLINKGIEEEKVIFCEMCQGPCKPYIILDGEKCENNFYIQTDNILHCDLIFIIGSDLLSIPFKDIVQIININNPWIIVINQKEIENFKFYDLSSKELFINGICENITTKIINDCGWDKEIYNAFNIKLK